MTQTKPKLRAVFLAALMVLWVFAGAVAFAGGAAAQSNTAEAQEGAEDNWASGERKWQGQTLYFESQETSASDANNADYAIHEYEAGASERVGDFITELSFQNFDEGVDGAYVIVDTSDLEGDYVITKGGSSESDMVWTTSDGVEEGTGTSDSFTHTDGGSGGPTANNPHVIVATQTLDTQFSSDTVNLGDSETLEIDSNRNSFDLEVTSDDLSQSGVYDAFENAEVDSVERTTDADGNQVVRLNGVTGSDELTVDFNDGTFDEGDNVSFDFTAVDTTASDSATIEVGEDVAAGANFDEASFTEQRGDVATFSLTTQEISDSDTVNVTVTGENDDYNANLVVSPENGEIEIAMNTYRASRTDNLSQVFTAETGNIVEENSSTGLAAQDRVIDAGVYDLIVAETSYGTAASEDEEYDLATLQIEERSTGDLNVYTAPSSEFTNFDNGDKGAIAQANSAGSITESSEIAIADSNRDVNNRRGDVIVHEIEVSGIYGALENTSTDSDAAALEQMITDGQFDFSIEQTNPGSNAEPKENSFDSDAHTVVADAENNTVYVIADSDDLDSPEVGEQYDVNFTQTAEFQNEFLRDRNAVDSNESVGNSFELVDRSATFDTQSGAVTVPAAADAAITGETTVAPGTEMRVRARATGEQAFLKTAETTVAEDGTFEAVFSGDDSFEDASSGQEFTASIRSQSFEDNAQTDGQVGEAESASVSISDVTAEGDEVSSITVDSAFLPQGGFVTIHDGSLNDGATFDSVRGTSDYLSEGDHEDVEVSLDEPYTEDGEAIAMAHQDTNGNEEYDFVDSEGSEDGAYENEDGGPVTDSASVSFEEEPDETPTETDGTETETDTETETETGDGDGADDQAGFGAVIALIALLGAALLAARRNAF